MGERADLCSTCKERSLRQTAEVVVHGESGGQFKDIGTRRDSDVEIVDKGKLG